MVFVPEREKGEGTVVDVAEFMVPDDIPVTTLYAFTDADGDQFNLDSVDGRWLAVSILSRDKTDILVAVLGEPDEARRLAGHLVAWAERREERRAAWLAGGDGGDTQN